MNLTYIKGEKLQDLLVDNITVLYSLSSDTLEPYRPHLWRVKTGKIPLTQQMCLSLILVHDKESFIFKPFSSLGWSKGAI